MIRKSKPKKKNIELLYKFLKKINTPKKINYECKK
jgi:hypothetical protein